MLYNKYTVNWSMRACISKSTALLATGVSALFIFTLVVTGVNRCLTLMYVRSFTYVILNIA